MDLTLGEAGRSGRFLLILPLSALDVIRASIQARNLQAAKDRPNDLWKTLMRRAAANAPVPVDAVLHRQTLSLAALQSLHVGQVLEIPRQAVEEIQLAIPQPGGRTALLAAGPARRLPGQQGRSSSRPRPTAASSPTSSARCAPSAGPAEGETAAVPEAPARDAGALAGRPRRTSGHRIARRVGR